MYAYPAKDASVDNDHPQARWLARLAPTGAPFYLRLAQALEDAVRAGELQPGDQLPPQRTVAELLGVDFTTVTRAYGAARARGLVEGAVGRGTFVRARPADDAGLVDLSMNLPPQPEGLSLGAVLRETIAAVLARTDPATLMAYHPGAGTLSQKTAGAAWLSPVLGEVGPERLLVSAGAQTALAGTLAALCKPGDAVIAQDLSYPGLRTAAQALGLRLVGCPGDGEGLSPEALDRLCAAARPTALYLTPAMHNPTAATMGLDRRRAVAAAARTHGLWLIEDDPYSRLSPAPLPAVATFAPGRGVHIATLSKTLSPGLRVAFVVCPDAGLAERIGDSLRALSLMPAPLMAAVAATWIREGTAETVLQGVRAEARARRALAATALPEAAGAAESLHVWLPLAQSWGPERLRLAAQDRGLSLVGADAFAVGRDHPNGVRISLGGPAKRTVLAEALAAVADLARDRPAAGRLVV
jgi:DNA-binding transcriptional MocR family regulator